MSSTQSTNMNANKNRPVRLLVAGALGFALVGLLIGLGSLRQAGPRVQLAYALAPGQTRTYDVTLTEDAQMAPFSTGVPMKARTDVAARVQLEGVRGTVPQGASLVSARFVSVGRAATTVDGRDVLGAADTLVGPAVTLVIGADGLVQQLSVPDAANPDFARVMQLVLLETALPLGSGSHWGAQEKLPRATFTSTVATQKLDADVVTLLRSRVVSASSAPRVDLTHKPNVQGGTSARVRMDGALLSLALQESVTAFDAQGQKVESRTTTVDVTLVAEGRVAEGSVQDAGQAGAQASAGGRVVDPAAPVMTEDAQRTALERRTEGLTRAALDAVMTDAVKNGTAPDHDKFLWRASARLKLDDGAVDDIAKQFARDDASDNGRGLVLDLLAAASSAHAQEALIALVQDPPASSPQELSRYRQRLALVPAPTPATIDFLIEQSRSGDESWRDPARIALGAASRHRRDLGDEMGAARASAALLDQVGTTAGDRAIEVMVLALGNTYDPEVVEEIAAYASHPRAQTRHVVAEALRAIDHDLARSTLLALASDTEAAVARRALESLQRQPLGTSAVDALRSATVAGSIPEHALASLVTTLTPHVQTSEGRAALEAVLARKPDPRLAARVRGILRGNPGP